MPFAVAVDMKRAVGSLLVCGICACASAQKRTVVEVAPRLGENFEVSVGARLATTCGLGGRRYHDAEEEAVERIADCLTSGDQTTAHVTISGSTDTRPRRLAGFLAERGVSVERITVIERGTMTSGMSETKIDKENDRRVRIEIGGD